MAVSRFLLLLLFLVASTASASVIKPSEFLCDEVERSTLRNQAENFMNECTDLPQVTNPIRLPDSRMHKETWEKTSFQARMDEVLESLRNLVKDVTNTTMPSVCGSSLLEKLAHNARNYLKILTHPSLTERKTTTPPRQRPSEKYSSDLRNILKHFNYLLIGKLEMLMREQEVHCP